jgi:hypothetical protein
VDNFFPSVRRYIIPVPLDVASPGPALVRYRVWGDAPPFWKVNAEKKLFNCRMRLVTTVRDIPKPEDLQHGLGSSYLSRGMILVNSFSEIGTNCFGTTSKCEACLPLYCFCSAIKSWLSNVFNVVPTHTLKQNRSWDRNCSQDAFNRCLFFVDDSCPGWCSA